MYIVYITRTIVQYFYIVYIYLYMPRSTFLLPSFPWWGLRCSVHKSSGRRRTRGSAVRWRGGSGVNSRAIAKSALGIGVAAKIYFVVPAIRFGNGGDREDVWASGRVSQQAEAGGRVGRDGGGEPSRRSTGGTNIGYQTDETAARTR